VSTSISTSAGGRASRTTLTTASDALRNEEVERTRTFLRIGWVVAVGVVALTLLVPGNRQIATALLSILAVAVLGSIWLDTQLRDAARFDPAKMTALAFACVVCGQLGVLYVGAFSAAPVLTALGLYFFCRTESFAVAGLMYAITAVSHGVAATLIITGVIEDPGFYRLRPQVSVAAEIAGQLILQSGYVLAFLMARLGRRASLVAIEELQEATRLAAQRDEQVQELRQDLDRALKIGGPGRFTGHTIGAWELGNVLGRGAMGEVYEGTHTTTGDLSAVKLLRRELLGARDYVERFLREVRAASTLETPHVVRVLEASTPEDPIPFLAMERLRGESLGDLLRKKETLPRARLGALVREIATVLDAAKDAGLVHRDLKPQNLWLSEGDGHDGPWKVLDFGVAHLGESSGTLTQGGVVGTPAYMAPEQARGTAIDHRADVYGLAAVIYRCVTGRVPFSSRDMPSLLYMVVHQMPPRPGAIAAVSPQIEAVLAIGMAKSRDARFATAGELAAAFDAADRGELPDALRQRARAILRQHPWLEPSPTAADTQQLAAHRRGD